MDTTIGRRAELSCLWNELQRQKEAELARWEDDGGASPDRDEQQPVSAR